MGTIKFFPTVLIFAGLVGAGTVVAATGGATEALATAGFESKTIQDDSGRSITYHISRPKAARAPLLLMIQGSGCGPVLAQSGEKVTSTIFNLQPFALEGKFAVLAVEKPFARETVTFDGSAKDCPIKFNADFTAETWLKALQASLGDARKLPWVDAKRTLLFGHSEGAVMASMLAAADSQVTDVISIGGSGTTQLFDFVALAYTCFDAPACLADIDRTRRDIAADPGSSTSFAWGHPYKRWASFLQVDAGDNLLRSKARVYLAFGTNDRAVPAVSQEIAVARLQSAGRDITVRRVVDANHSLVKGSGYKTTDQEYRLALDWFWAGAAVRLLSSP